MAQQAAATDPPRGEVDLDKGPATGPLATSGNHAHLGLGLEEGCGRDTRKGKTVVPPPSLAPHGLLTVGSSSGEAEERRKEG